MSSPFNFNSTYQVAVSYNGKKLIPGPYFELSRDITRTPDGTVRLRTWKIVVKGKTLAFAGSPDDTGAFWTGSGYPPDPSANSNAPSLRYANLQQKMGAIENLFSQDGYWFQVQPGDGSAPLKFTPRITSIAFADGNWFNEVPYTINMEADCIYFGNNVDATCAYNALNNPPEETWAVEPIDPFRPTYKVTHTVTAAAHNLFSSNGDGMIDQYGWQLADATVASVLGYNSSFVSSVFGVSYSNFNYTKSKTVDEPSGKVTVVETWTLSATNTTQDQTCESTYSLETGFWNVKASGSIVGLQVGTDTTTRYTNAETAAATILNPSNLLAAAVSMSGIAGLNPVIISQTITRNKPIGTISYGADFNTRPAPASGYLTESTSITLDYATPVVAEIGVINRSFGPVPQPIGSNTQQMVTVQTDCMVQVSYGSPPPAIPSYDTYNIFTTYIGNPPTQWVASDKESFNIKNGRYSRTTVFKYQWI